ncbi:MAG: hypothetical protein AAFQ33_05215 [Pseudomonadota bacterium]
MKRREFVKAAALTGATGTLAAPAVAQGRRRLRIVNAWSAQGAGRGEIAQMLGARVSALSGSSLTFDLIDRGNADHTTMLTAVRGGDVDGIVGSEEMWSDLHPAFGLFTSTPGGMTERELEAWIRSNTGQDTWDAFAATYGLKGLYLGDTGAEYMWTKSAITDAKQFAGKRIATSGLSAAVFSGLGAQVATPAADLSVGGVDAFEAGSLADQYQSGMEGMGHFYTNTPTRPSSAMSLSMNKALWDGLSGRERGQLTAAATAITHTVNAAAMQRNALAFQALRFRSGLTIDELPMDAWAGLMAAATPVFDGIADRDAEGKRVVRAYRRFASAVQNWTMVADGAFTLARARSI